MVLRSQIQNHFSILFNLEYGSLSEHSIHRSLICVEHSGPAREKTDLVSHKIGYVFDDY